MSTERQPGDGTRVVHAGLPAPGQGEPFLPGPVFAAPFHVTGDPAGAPYAYTRYGNPTWQRYESALGELEDAEAVLFSSGMAAAAALLLTQTRPGDAIAVDESCYLGIRRLATTHLGSRGIDVRLAPPERLAQAAEGAVMLWLETPSNPKLEVYDISALAGAARAAGALTVVDNTTAGPLLQRPLDLGADVTLTSATKQMSGHADLLLGYLTTRDPERAQICATGAATPARSPAPSKPGWHTVRSPPWRCGWSEGARTPWRWRACSPHVTTCSRWPIPGCRATPATTSRGARCVATEWCCPSTWAARSAPSAFSPRRSW